MYTTRRSLLVALGAAGLATTVGCSSKDSSMAGTESAAPSVSSDAEAVFPATIKHKFGTTTVDKRPERVAVVGYTEQDTVLAFGFKPVLVRNWYGPDKVIQPWAKELAGDLSLTGTDLGTGAIDVEKVAASNPDLIIGSALARTRSPRSTPRTPEHASSPASVSPCLPRSRRWPGRSSTSSSRWRRPP